MLEPLSRSADALRKLRWSLFGSTEPSEFPQTFPLLTAKGTVGRRTDCDFVLRSPLVSGHHAEYVTTDDQLFVRDRQSTNGTYVNGKRITADTPLATGDLVQFADLEFRVEQHADKPSSPNETFPRGTMVELCLEEGWLYTSFNKLKLPGGLQPHFQPIVSMATTSVIGFEVLARSEVDGLRNPADMFRTAEMLSQGIELSRLCQVRGLSESLDCGYKVFLNTHADEIHHHDFLIALEQFREKHADREIVIEIHEKAALDTPHMCELINSLHELGYEVAYDDFGTGETRLPQLIKAAPDYVKFDIGLIRGLESDRMQRKLVTGLVDLARTLGITPLAEGIETLEVAQVCLDIGFDLAQGFFYGRPAPASAWS